MGTFQLIQHAQILKFGFSSILTVESGLEIVFRVLTEWSKAGKKRNRKNSPCLSSQRSELNNKDCYQTVTVVY